MTHSRGTIAALLAQIDRRPRQSLGQNFVADANTVRKIVRLAGIEAGDRVVEIGAGLGSLTLALLDVGASVIAIEIDGDLVPILREQVEPRGATVVQADAMTIDWPACSRHAGSIARRSWRTCRTTCRPRSICDLLDGAPQIDRMLVMVQREVAERLVAQPGSGAYGIPSVKVAYWARARIVGQVPATVFVPQPKVESSLVEIIRRDTPATDVDVALLFALVRAGFGQRRKMLRRSLAEFATSEQLERAGVSPEDRAESLSVQAWSALAAVVGEERTS